MMIDFKKLIDFLKLKQTEYKAESSFSGMFSSSYWDGKSDMIDEILDYLDNKIDVSE